MNILYHEYKVDSSEYGADGHLTNNWNPDNDYHNEYVSVCYDINTPSYDYSNGFKTNEDRDEWNAEASQLISSFGIEEESGYGCKSAYLYAHPQQISGVVKKNDVKRIAKAITAMKLSSLRWVNLSDTVYVISDEDYNKYLDGKLDIIRKKIFELSATKRTTTFCNAFDVARSVAGYVRLKRLGLNDGLNYGGGQTIDYILNVINTMIDEGLLKSFERDGSKFIRSLNKTEQKKAKIAC